LRALWPDLGLKMNRVFNGNTVGRLSAVGTAISQGGFFVTIGRQRQDRSVARITLDRVTACGGMESGMTRRIYVLTGPTAVGKTALALRWAETHDAEIISCDSLLLYRGMDIGTAFAG
jgi:hypothetical protein